MTKNLDKQTADAKLSVGKKIFVMRKAAGLTQTRLGEMLGLPRESIARVEKGGQNVTLETLVRLANALRKQLDVRFSKS